MTRFWKIIPFPPFKVSWEITKNTKLSGEKINQGLVILKASGEKINEGLVILKICRISFNQNYDGYDFFYFDSVIDNFLTNLKNRFVPITNGTRYSRMNQEKLVEDSLYKIRKDMVCLSAPYYVKFLKGVFHKFYLAHSWIPWPKWYGKNQMQFLPDQYTASHGWRRCSSQ